MNFSGKTDLAKIISPYSLVRLIAENRPYLSVDDFVEKVSSAAKDAQMGDVKGVLIAVTKRKDVVLHDVASST